MGSMAFVFRERLGHTLREELQNGIMHHYNVTARGPNSLVEIWDHIQNNVSFEQSLPIGLNLFCVQFHCCGIQNYEDWFMIDAWKTDRWVPDSCCIPNLEFGGNGIPCGQTNSTYWYPSGCANQIHMWFVHRLHIVGVVGLVVAFIQVGYSCTMLYAILQMRMY